MKYFAILIFFCLSSLGQDPRVLDWIKLKKEVEDNQEKIKNYEQLILDRKNEAKKKYKEELDKYIKSKSKDTEKEQEESLKEIINNYEIAIKHNPNIVLSDEDLYNLSSAYFEVENFEKSVSTFKLLIEKYPDFALMDNVYYLYGLALWSEGDFSLGADYFKKLLKEYPKSRFVEEVWFRLGEYYFDVAQYDKAIKYYQKVANNEKSNFYDKALYKIAWSYYQKDEFDNAINNFTRALEHLLKIEKTPLASGMRAEINKYIVKSFQEKMGIRKEEGVELIKAIEEYLSKLKDPRIKKEILLEAAKQLYEEGSTDGAILAFKAIKNLNPNGPDNPKIDIQIVDILEEADRWDLAEKKNLELIEEYGPNSAWIKAQKDNLKSLAQAREAVRDALLSLAVNYHKKAKEAKEKGNEEEASLYYEKAASLYFRYIKQYPERDDIPQAIFYFAESQYEIKHYERALEGYGLLKDFLIPIPESIRRDATYNIVFTFRHILEEEATKGLFKEIDFDKLTSKDGRSERIDIPDLGLKYLAAIEDFLQIAPKDPQAPVLLFHAAAIYYVYGHTDTATAQFFKIINNYPSSIAANASARLLLDDALAKEDWPLVIELANRFKKEDLRGQKDEFAKIEDLAKFKNARAIFEKAKNKQDFKKSKEMFLELLSENPNSPYADVMLYNAAKGAELGLAISESLSLYKRLYTEYPKSIYAKESRFREALLLEKMLKFSEAANAYDEIARLYPKSKEASDAMLNKALLYEAAGDLNKAALAFIISKDPMALLIAASLYKKMGQINKEIAMLEQFIKQYEKDKSKTKEVIEAHVNLADTYIEQGNEKRGMDHYRLAVKKYNPELKSDFAAFFAAKAQMALLRAERNAFMKTTINAKSSKAQGEQLKTIMKKLTELSQKYENVIKTYAQPLWNGESLYSIGLLYEHLAQVLIKSPCPNDVATVDEFACDEYIVLLEDKAAILEDKAAKAFIEAYDIVISSYDAPTKLVDDVLLALNRLRPGQYQKVGSLIEQPNRPGFFAPNWMRMVE